MELSEFIRNTLVDIVHGVRGANQDVGPSGSPPKSAFTLVSSAVKEGGFVEFDAAVTLETSDSIGAGGGLKIAVLNAQLGGEEKTSEQRVSRIRFKVGINQYLE